MVLYLAFQILKMEKLKSLVPPELRRMVRKSTTDDLVSASSSLLQLFLDLPQFDQMVSDLADFKGNCCGKNKEAAVELKLKGNRCYLGGDLNQALTCYSQALRLAPLDADDMDRNLVATLFLNRSNVLHKMGLLVESLRDCNRALQISPYYAKAWYRRGKTNASLGNYEDAVRDLALSKSLEPSLAGKKQVESELKTILDHPRLKSTGPAQHSVNRLASLDHLSSIALQRELQCVSTADKGRGMASACDIPQATLVHIEEPFSLIISKECRETHCHFCLNELPADTVPCPSCAITLYCSEYCQVRSGGRMFRNDLKKYSDYHHFPHDLAEYIASITLCNNSNLDTEQTQEHQHECQGVNWPVVLPSDVVLAGRALVKLIKQRGVSMDLSNLQETLDLYHNYSKMNPESKLELHIYSIVLLWCLYKSYCSELLLCGISVSQIIILLSKIKVNSMAIVCVKSSGAYLLSEPSRSIPHKDHIQSIEQIRVGQAIYMTGSLFNHSCKPNTHAYFLSRRLLIQTTEFVPAGCPLELSYGPEVGKWNCKERLKFLEDEYFFRCQCHGCSEINTSDLVIDAYRCPNLNCSGVVLDSYVARCEEHKLKHAITGCDERSFEHHLQVGKTANVDIGEMASIFLGKNKTSLHIDPGSCLKCGSSCDLESSRAVADKAWTYMRRLEDLTVSEDLPITVLSDSLRSLDMLKSVLHMYSKGIAEAEDNAARMSCLVGDLQAARNHCKASIKVVLTIPNDLTKTMTEETYVLELELILETLYTYNHVVIGYELVKLASIQLCLGDGGAVESINRLCDIFWKYYGSHAEIIFPYLRSVKKEATKFKL